jgi:hypothetical protein
MGWQVTLQGAEGLLSVGFLLQNAAKDMVFFFDILNNMSAEIFEYIQ